MGFGYYPYSYPGYYTDFYPAYPVYYPSYGSTIVDETIVADGAYPAYEPVPIEPEAEPAVPGPEPIPPEPEPVDSAAPTTQPAEPEAAQQPEAAMANLLAQGDYAFAQGQYEEALSRYTQAAAITPDNPHPKFALALANIAIGDYPAAAAALREAMPLFPELHRSEADLRQAYRIPGDFQRHLNALIEYTRQNEKDPDGWLTLGYIQYFTGARAAALESLGKAVVLKPDDTSVRRFVEAAEALQREAETRPTPPPDTQSKPDADAPANNGNDAAKPQSPEQGAEGAGTQQESETPTEGSTAGPQAEDDAESPKPRSGLSVEFGPPGMSPS